MPQDGKTAYYTVQIKRGFGTTAFRPRMRLADGRAPLIASRRAYLRRGLPSIYHENDLSMRFVGGLETVLDPIFAVLDCLSSYFRADLAPRDLLELLAAWLGVDVEETWPEERRREIVRHAAELSRRRGTKAGLALMLRVAFPDYPLRVEDGGGVTWGTDPDAPLKQKEPEFFVYCDVPLPEAVLGEISRAIEAAKPVHAGYRLRVKAPRKEQKDKPEAE